jgi:hypothetical protein
MDDATFWRLIEQTRPADNDSDRHCEATTAALAKQEPEEILWFGHIFGEYHLRAYRRDLWSIIYEIDGGCSDDGFIDFRAWLVMQGQDVYETVLAAPDYLGEITLEECERRTSRSTTWPTTPTSAGRARRRRRTGGRRASAGAGATHGRRAGS